MAARKKVADQEIPVEEKLKSLYKLQSYLSEIDRIKTLRGELPLEVADLDDDIAGLGTRIGNHEVDLKQLEENANKQKGKIETSKIKVERYTQQLDNVRNSKEYDHLSKEIEFETLEMELAEKHIREYAEKVKDIKEKIAVSNERLQEKKTDLEHKKKELDDIVSETKSQEEKLREKAKKTETTIEVRLLTAFKRIRKNARNGLGIVPIQRGACGGCFNKIPPQKQMDIKLGKKIIVCEYCGRIMIDSDMVS
ncbi:MAG: C4-type zinc ribbon domain-containing protein [Dysgonamonadaceae bacterium]|jgi:predicted  nucleic acid-binding Zn-ribbon protein|nr:C4-type zinc ribbon domain-containing protein [Dysgonamonadaceae bacterium]